MQDLPDNAALLKAIEAFLQADVMPTAEPSLAFRARVAVNVLGMVRRHLEQAACDHGLREREQLQALTGKKGTMAGLTTEVCRLIADGTLNPDDPRVRDYLWLTTLQKVAVDQPRYVSYQRAQDAWDHFQHARRQPAAEE
ncbi:DUF6285 domain-containing protein [uncultured Marinobacter sp.]|uniref:DUF6285 domain-containing protein n=1 Tax=uncultured Marinobacter sp. TaxID=187379 RepID=UPI0030DD2D18